MSGHDSNMSTRTSTKGIADLDVTSIDDIDLREVHHAEELHNGEASDCAQCDVDEIRAFNGYEDGFAEWHAEIDTFLDNFTDHGRRVAS